MTLKALTVVVLRLFAIQYFVQTILASFTYLPPLLKPFDSKYFLIALSYPTGLLILSVVLWLLAGRFAALATRGIDGPLPFNTLTREDIYCCAFVILGLNFVLGSIGSTLQELYQYIRFFAEDTYPASSLSQLINPLARHGLTLIFGLACILGAQAWTRKLLRLEKSEES